MPLTDLRHTGVVRLWLNICLQLKLHPRSTSQSTYSHLQCPFSLINLTSHLHHMPSQFSTVGQLPAWIILHFWFSLALQTSNCKKFGTCLPDTFLELSEQWQQVLPWVGRVPGSPSPWRSAVVLHPLWAWRIRTVDEGKLRCRAQGSPLLHGWRHREHRAGWGGRGGVAQRESVT